MVKTLEELPPNATHWSTRSMAKAMGMSQTAIVRIWRDFGLQPHRVENFKLSNDPLFIDKVKDVVGLYLNRQMPPSSSASMRSRRSRPSIAPNQSFPCDRGSPNGGPTTIAATARPRCSRLTISSRVR